MYVGCVYSTMSVVDYIRDLPFDEIKKSILFMRRRYFEVDIPNVSGLLVDIPHDELEHAAIADYHYEEVDYYTYHYDGEKANIRTPDGFNDDGKQMENHIRGFEIEHSKWKTLILAHRETSRFNHWDSHINDVGLSWEDGISRTTELLDDLDVEYERTTTEEAFNEVHEGDHDYDL